MDALLPIIMDNGSCIVKVGFAGEETPNYVYNIVGTPTCEGTMIGMHQKDSYVGNSAQTRRALLSLKHPCEHGIVTSWDDMEKVWEHALYGHLQVDPKDHPILLTEPPFNPKMNREKMAEIMFEKFDVPAVYVAIQAVLSLYASGRYTGIVVDSGHGVTHIVPVADGRSFPLAMKRMDLAGSDLDQYLSTLMYDRGYAFSSSGELEIVREIKEKMCYVAQDYVAEMEKTSQTGELTQSFTLPDGQVVKLGKERFQCPEALFTPTNHLGLEIPGVSQATHNSIMRCGIGIRQEMWASVVLSGGSTMFPGFSTRLLRDLVSFASQSVEVNIFAPPERIHFVWIGGSVMASLNAFKNMWITKSEFIENGPEILYRKCF